MATQPNTPRPRSEQYAEVVKGVFDNPDVLDGVNEFDKYRKEQLKAQFSTGKKGLSINPIEALKRLNQTYQALQQPLGFYESLESNPNLNVPKEKELEVRVSLGAENIEKKLGNLD